MKTFIDKRVMGKVIKGGESLYFNEQGSNRPQDLPAGIRDMIIKDEMDLLLEYYGIPVNKMQQVKDQIMWVPTKNFKIHFYGRGIGRKPIPGVPPSERKEVSLPGHIRVLEEHFFEIGDPFTPDFLTSEKQFFDAHKRRNEQQLAAARAANQQANNGFGTGVSELGDDNAGDDSLDLGLNGADTDGLTGQPADLTTSDIFAGNVETGTQDGEDNDGGLAQDLAGGNTGNESAVPGVDTGVHSEEVSAPQGTGDTQPQ